MRIEVAIIAQAVNIVYELPHGINKNAEAMDMLCLFTSMYYSKNKDVSSVKLGLSEAVFAKRVRQAKNRIEYQNALPKAEAIRETMDRIGKVKTLTN